MSENMNYERVIEELNLFIKKVLADPGLIEQSMNITRELIDEEEANAKIGAEISAGTSIKIPVEHSEADRMFIEALKEAVRDEKALY